MKREDTNHTGAHKINNTVGQALLARRMGKRRLLAETGAGQHGVATATVGAKFGLPVDVYMGARDVERQALNVHVMRLLGATVHAVEQRNADAQGCDQRSVSRVGGARRRYVLRDRQRRRRASVSVSRARAAESDRHRGAPPSARALRAPAERRGRVRRRRQQRDRHLCRVSSTIRREAVGRRGRRRGRRERQDRRVAERRQRRRAARLAFVPAAERRGAGACRRTRSARASTIRASGPSTRFSKRAGARRTSASPTREALDAFHEFARSEGIVPALESAHAIAFARELAARARSGRSDPRQPQRPRRQRPRRDGAASSAARVRAREARTARRLHSVPHGRRSGSRDDRRSVDALSARGRRRIELGIPYSDPLADGPTIAAARSARARRRNAARATCSHCVRRRAARCAPLLLFTYFNPVDRFGIERFAREAAAAGRGGRDRAGRRAGGIGASLRDALARARLGMPLLVAPSTPRERAARIARGRERIRLRRFAPRRDRRRQDAGFRAAASAARDAARVDGHAARGRLRLEPRRGRSRSPRSADGVVVGSALIDAYAGASGGKPRARVKRFVAPLVGAARGPRILHRPLR